MCTASYVVCFKDAWLAIYIYDVELQSWQSWEDKPYSICLSFDLYAIIDDCVTRHQFQAYMWKRVSCLWNCYVSNCVNNLSLNFDKIRATLLSIVYLALASERLFEPRPNTIPTLGIRLSQNTLDSECNLNSITINSAESAPYIHPWLLELPGFQLSLHLLGNKLEVSYIVFQ